MATIGKLAVKLTAATASFDRGIQGAINHINTLQSTVAGVGKTIGRTLAAGGALVGLGSLAGGITFGASLAAQAEQSQIAFSTMLGDAEVAKQTLADLSQFAAETHFELPELRTAGQSLLAFGTSAEDLIPTLRAIGDVSAGVGAPINEIAQIYGKARVQGRLFAEDVNQFTGRGIPIIQELAKQFGVAESEVKNLVEKGKVNFLHLEKAFADMTGEGGKFSGLMAAQSQSLLGIFSNLKDNIGMTLRDIMAAVMDAVGFKDGLSALNDFVQSVGQRMTAMVTQAKPIIQQVISTVVGGFQSIVAFVQPIAAAWYSMFLSQLTAIWQIFQQVWSSVSSIVSSAMEAIGLSGSAFGSFRDTIVAGLVAMEYGWQNWQSVLALAITTAQLHLVRFGNQVQYVFGTVIPTLVQFGVDNWRELLTDMVNFTMTVFDNMSKNVIGAVSAIWEFIKSGGTSGFNFEWTPLTDGFESSLKELPKIAEREIGGLEAQLASDVNALSSSLAEGFDDFVQRRMDEIFGAGNAAVGGPSAIPAPERTLSDVVSGRGSDDDMADLKKEADKIRKSLETPADKLASEINRINELESKGLLTSDVAAMARGKAMIEASKSLEQAPTNAGKALEAGTAEAFSAANTKIDKRNKTEEHTRATAEASREMVQLLREYLGGTGDSVRFGTI